MDNITADNLILKVAQGDMSALEQLYNGLARQVYAFAMTIVKSPATAEDIMQDTFMRVYRSAKAFHPGGSGCGWVLRIARNLAFDALAKGAEYPQELSESEADCRSTEESAVQSAALESAMDVLTPEERQVVTLHAVSGLRLNEIAAVLDKPLGTIKWYHSRALKKLRRELNREEAE